MSDAEVKAAIHARSVQLEKHGTYWGWADWIAWGWSAQTRVHMILGDSRNPIFETFCLPHVHRVSVDWLSDLYVVACRCSGKVDGISWADVSHFVHATPVHGDPAAVHPSCNSSLEDKLASMLKVASSSDVNAAIFDAYFDRDWAVTFTATDGDCACDTIAVHTGSPRTAPTFVEIRACAAAMMRTLAVEDWFRQAFCLAQEHGPRIADPVAPVAGPPSPVAVDSDADIDGSVPPLPPPLPPPAPPPLVAGDPGPGANSSKDSSSSSSSSSSSDCEGGSVGGGSVKPDVVSDAAVLTWAMQRTDVGKKLLDDYGEPCNDDVLNIVALEELVTLRHEHAMACPPLCRPAHPTASRRRNTLVQRRLETGRKYLEWYDEQPEDVRRHGLRNYAIDCGYPEPITKSTRQALYRCYKDYEHSVEKPGDWVLTLPGSAAIAGLKKPHQRLRRIGFQGKPEKCPELHHLLFQWFVDYRKVVKGRLLHL